MKTLLRKLYNSLNHINIIMVHHVTDDTPLVYSCIISKNNFFSYIKNRNFVSFDEGIKNFKRHNDLCILTIDDALDNLYTTIFPICKENNIPFTAFISAELLDKPGYITTNQLIEMSQNPLVTIGSHGCNHIKLNECDKQTARYEIFASKEKLEKLIGKKIELFSYPNGAVNKNILKLTKKAGYRYATGVTPRHCNILSKLSNKYLLPRYNLTNDTVDTLN